MATTTFHLIGFGFVALMWAVIAVSLLEIARSLRGYLAPHASALYDAIREDWSSVRPHAKKHAAPKAGRVCHQHGTGVRGGSQTPGAQSTLMPPLKGRLRAA